MMSPADEIWLARLLEAIQRTKRYQERGEAEFFGNEDTQQLVIVTTQVVGPADGGPRPR